MATKIGPKTVTQRDRSKNLVFCVDAACSRSYGGEPTTNLAPPDLADWNPSGTSVRTAAGYTFQGQPVYKCRTQVGSSWIGIDKTISGLRTAASGSTVCMSIWVKNPNPSGYNFSAYIGHDFSSNRNLAANSGWQKIEWTVAVGSMANDYVEYRPYTNSADIYIHMTMPQVEVKAVSTPFTTSSRSATTAITNISGVGAQGTNWIQGSAADTYGQQLYKPTVRNVLATIGPNQGHIGGAYWDLDGSDECIEGDDANLPSGNNPRTILFWMNHDGVTDAWGSIINYGGQASGAALAVGTGWMIGWNNTAANIVIGKYGDNCGANSTTIASGVWVHFAVTYDGTTVKYYLNGDADGTSTWGSAPNTVVGDGSAGTIRIGRSIPRWGGGGQLFNGQVANTMIWSSALTAKEVKDIYIAQKGRFGK